MKINLEKLEEYIKQYETDKKTSKNKSILSLNNPITDFMQKVSGRRRFNPMSGMSPLKHPGFRNVELKLKASIS